MVHRPLALVTWVGGDVCLKMQIPGPQSQFTESDALGLCVNQVMLMRTERRLIHALRE